jgi:hypothetical protein
MTQSGQGPLISVLILCCKHANFIRRILGQRLQQTFDGSLEVEFSIYKNESYEAFVASIEASMRAMQDRRHPYMQCETAHAWKNICVLSSYQDRLSCGEFREVRNAVNPAPR